MPLCLQCEKKETFIQQIQSLDIETQATIASCIQQVRLSAELIKSEPPKYKRYSQTDRQHEDL